MIDVVFECPQCGRRVHLGYFNCVTAAGLAYVKSSLEFHKEFSSIEV